MIVWLLCVKHSQRNQSNRLGNTDHGRDSTVTWDLQEPDFTLLTPEPPWCGHNRLSPRELRSLGGVTSSLWDVIYGREQGTASLAQSSSVFLSTDFTAIKGGGSCLTGSATCVCVEWTGQTTESDLRMKSQMFGSLLHCW